MPHFHTGCTGVDVFTYLGRVENVEEEFVAPLHIPLANNQAKSLVMQKPAGPGNEDWTTKQPCRLLGHCHQERAFIEHVVAGNITHIELLLLAAIAVTPRFKEIWLLSGIRG